MPSFLSRTGFDIPTFQLFKLVEFHLFFFTHPLALSARHFLRKKSPYQHKYALGEA